MPAGKFAKTIPDKKRKRMSAENKSTTKWRVRQSINKCFKGDTWERGGDRFKQEKKKG